MAYTCVTSWIYTDLQLYRSSVPCSTIKCKLLTLEIKIKKPIYIHCKLIFWLTLVHVSDQQEVNQCYTFILSSVLQHCRKRWTTFQRNRMSPPFGFQVSLKSTMKMEAVRSSERLVPTNQTTSQLFYYPTNALTYLLTYSLEQSPSWEANQVCG